jgi:hypothetical protein
VHLSIPVFISHLQDFSVTRRLWPSNCVSRSDETAELYFLPKAFRHRKGEIMKRYLSFILGLVFVPLAASAADNVMGAVSGTVKHVGAGTKTIVVKTADGTGHTFHFVAHTSVHGAEGIGKGAKDTFHGLKEGGHAVVH